MQNHYVLHQAYEHIIVPIETEEIQYGVEESTPVGVHHMIELQDKKRRIRRIRVLIYNSISTDLIFQRLHTLIGNYKINFPLSRSKNCKSPVIFFIKLNTNFYVTFTLT